MSRLGQAGNMTLVGLGSLQTFDFGTPGVKKAGGITIVNTQITKLDGLNMATEILSLDVSDNKFLSQIGMNITKVGSINIGPNNVAQGQQAQFPNLQPGPFLSFRNCTVVNVPSLTNVSTILGLYGNLFTSFSAPNLTWAGGVVVDDNSKLTNLSFPQLKTVNSSNATLQIANNSQLLKVDGFPKLDTVKGNVDLSGAMDEYVPTFALPILVHSPLRTTLWKTSASRTRADDLLFLNRVDFNGTIKLIDGAFDLDTSSKVLKCDDTNKLTDNQVVRGKVSCQSGDENPTSADGSNGGSSDGSSSSNVAIPMAMPEWYTSSGLLVSVLSFFFLL